MTATGFTDTIRHFIGYMRISDTMQRSEELFDGRHGRLADDDGAPHKDDRNPRVPELDDLPSRPIHFGESSTLDALSPLLSGKAQAYSDAPQASARIAGGTSFSPVQQVDLPTFAGSARQLIQVQYGEGGIDGHMLIHQRNAMEDNDLVTTQALLGADGQNYVPPHLNLLPLYADMIAQADHAVPSSMKLMSGNTTTSIADAVMAQDDAWSDAGAMPWQAGQADNTITPVENGRYVDGQLSSDVPEGIDVLLVTPWRVDAVATGARDGPAPVPVVADVDQGNTGHGVVTQSQLDGMVAGGSADGSLVLQSVITGPTGSDIVISETGLNTQTNAAVIRDLNEASRSMIVGGDYFFTQGIIQTNILTDSDHIDIATSGAGLPFAFGSGNQVHNIAEFRHQELNALPGGAAATPNWQIDVFKGDFYDVKALYQFNNMIDGDVTVQTTTGIFASVQTGFNEQTNFAQVSGLDAYDLIIVLGNYHRADWIYQCNIVLDVDHVTMLSAGDSDGASRATTGFNNLTNDAVISTYDSNAFSPMNGAHHQLLDALSNHDAILTPNPEWQLAGNASGTLRVLYVQGDYYDINAISQTNLLYDVDQVIQAGDRTDAAMGAATGGNIALNEARILDPGTLSASKYLGGQEYEASVLIQTNIVTDSDQIVIHDTQTLIPELIAFTQTENEHGGCDGGSRPVSDPSHNYDNFGNMN